MSLTSYRAAPPRVTVRRPVGGGRLPAAAWGPLRWSVSCPTGSWSSEWVSRVDLGGPGGDRLSRALRHSTMGAEAFDGRVRDGIGSGGFAWATRPAKIDAPPSARGTGLGGVGGGGVRKRVSGRRRSSRREGWAWSDEGDQAERAISTGQLHASLRFHTRPIDVVVFHGSSGRTRFEVGFELRCLQLLSRPHIATLHCGWRHNRSTRGAFVPVLSY